MRHGSIAATFVDAGAAAHLLTEQQPHNDDKEETDPIVMRKRLTYTHDTKNSGGVATASEFDGSALGPDWAEALTIGGCMQHARRRLHIRYNVEAEAVYDTRANEQLCEPPELAGVCVFCSLKRAL